MQERLFDGMLRVGFTGTRKGWTDPQDTAIRALLADLDDSGEEIVLLHGDCVGADAGAAAVSSRLGWAQWVFPPENDKYRAWREGDRIETPAPYLVRNQSIVDACDILVATPAEMGWQRKGGTWHTIRYAQRQSRPHTIVWPDGAIVEPRYAPNQQVMF